MSKSFRGSFQSHVLEYDASYSAKEIHNIISKNNLEGLTLSQHLPMLEEFSNIDFLSEFTFLECLYISRYKCLRYHFLKHLSLLKKLSINTFDKNEIDVSVLIKLNIFFIKWRPKLFGLEYCNRLNELTLQDFKPEKDLKKVNKATSVKKLHIKGSSITSLNGIEELRNLEELLLGNCRGITSLSQLSDLKKLHTITLNGVNENLDFESLDYLPNIREFFVVGCKNPPSSNWVKERMPNVLNYRGDS
jgi:hypothetical protein